MSTDSRYGELKTAVQDQLKVWNSTLDVKVGGFAFASATVCLLTPVPNILASIFLLWVVQVWRGCLDTFPSTIKGLRATAQDLTNDERIVEAIFAEDSLNRLDEEFFNHQELITKTPMLVLGMLFLVGVVATPHLNFLRVMLTHLLA